MGARTATLALAAIIGTGCAARKPVPQHASWERYFARPVAVRADDSRQLAVWPQRVPTVHIYGARQFFRLDFAEQRGYSCAYFRGDDLAAQRDLVAGAIKDKRPLFLSHTGQSYSRCLEGTELKLK